MDRHVQKNLIVTTSKCRRIAVWGKLFNEGGERREKGEHRIQLEINAWQVDEAWKLWLVCKRKFLREKMHECAMNMAFSVR